MAVSAIVGGSLIGAGATAYGASKAADAQKSAAKSAAATQMYMFNKMQDNLSPYMKGGLESYNQLLGAMPELTKTFNPTMEQLEQTPGYQWALNQGLKGTQNSYAAKGLGTSGAAMKGAAEYAQGLASNTYQQQLQNYMAQNLQKYNMLMGGTQIGQSSAAGVGAAGIQTGQGVANSLMAGGNASAAGWNALGSAGNQLGGNLMQYGLMNSMGMFNNAGANSGGTVLGGMGPLSLFA